MRNMILSISCDSVAEIKDNKFLILKNYNDFGMTKTDLKGFKEHLLSLKEVFQSTWNEKRKQEYKDMCEEVGITKETIE